MIIFLPHSLTFGVVVVASCCDHNLHRQCNTTTNTARVIAYTYESSQIYTSERASSSKIMQIYGRMELFSLSRLDVLHIMGSGWYSLLFFVYFVCKRASERRKNFEWCWKLRDTASGSIKYTKICKIIFSTLSRISHFSPPFSATATAFPLTR